MSVLKSTNILDVSVNGPFFCWRTKCLPDAAENHFNEGRTSFNFQLIFHWNLLLFPEVNSSQLEEKKPPLGSCRSPSSRLRSCSSGSGRPGSPGLLLLLLPAAVDGLGAGPKLSEPQSTQTQLEVLRDLSSTRPDLFQPLDGCLGQRKVADRWPRLHSHLTPTHGWEVPLSPDHHLVLAWVQQPPVVPVRS